MYVLYEPKAVRRGGASDVGVKSDGGKKKTRNHATFAISSATIVREPCVAKNNNNLLIIVLNFLPFPLIMRYLKKKTIYIYITHRYLGT